MLTQRQLQLLKFIQDYVLEHNVSPSFEEMRSALRLKSKSGIHRLIQGLEERGFIRRLAYRARALEVVKLADAPPGEAEEDALEASSNVVRGAFRRPRPRAAASGAGSAAGATTTLPIYGRIAAGTPIEALADTSAALEVPSLLVGPGEHYVLQVVGESMIEAGILDGDYAIIQRCDNAENGSIVVALVEDREVTLKRLRRRGASVALEPANAAFETRIFGPSQVRVQGRLVGLIRRY